MTAHDDPREDGWIARARSAADLTGEAFHLVRGGRPVAAARDWVRAGMFEGLAPSERILEQIRNGPEVVELSAEEFETLEALLVPEFTEQLGPIAEPVCSSLLSRGILMRAGHGLALAPAYVKTIGIAHWVDARRITVVEADDDAPTRADAAGAPVIPSRSRSRDWLDARLLGDQAVMVRTTRAVVRVSTSTSTEIADVIVRHAREVSLRLVLLGTLDRSTEEGAQAEVGAGIVDLMPDGPHGLIWRDARRGRRQHVDSDGARGRLLRSLDAGLADDRAAAEQEAIVASIANRGSLRRGIAWARDISPLGLAAAVLFPSAQDRRAAGEYARLRTKRATEYWQPQISFVQRAAD